MSLGSTIGKARVSAGLSIDQLAELTSIRPRMLVEMENDEFLHCGGETYARGHLRNIARKLNVDPRIFLTLYDEEQMADNRLLQDKLIENSAMAAPKDAPKISWKVLAIISIISVAIVGFAQIIITNTRAPSKVAATAQATPSPSQSVAPPAPAQTFSSGEGVSVVIEAARAKSWLLVSDASGSVLFSGQISTGAIKTFTSSQRLIIKVGNAGGVDFLVNGKKIDPIGADGEVVTVSYGVGS